MTNRNPETTQFTGDAGTGNLAGGSSNNNLLPPPDTSGGNGVFKSGPLFLSSMNGLGWTTWKKRWFILTRTSLVFFRSDPSAIPQRGSEANLTLGGIDLNNSGSVVLKADKKLLTVVFNDGGSEGRTFTLKAETTEDLYEWKTALESALAQSPNASLATRQDDVVNESDAKNGSSEQTKDRQPAKSTVIGRPILLALEEVDGSPSFLEKALRFIEEKGVRVEGILRQAADVEHVEHRIREYEQGKTEFVLGEDAHVIADCVKYIIRELPSHAVPTSCCNALLDACRKSAGENRRVRINCFRVAICETFPEPNRRLLQRILEMMQVVASHKNENLMSPSAVAACMAPLLLRPLLLGECELDNDFDVGGDGSMQLLQAAAAANHAQAIVITLLEEYPRIFGEGDVSPELYTDSDVSGSEEVTDDDDELDDLTGESDEYSDEEIEIISSGSGSYDSDDDEKDLDVSNSGSKSPTGRDKLPLKSGEMSIGGDAPKREDVPDQQDASTDASSIHNIENQHQYPTTQECDSEMKSLTLEPIDYDFEDETDVQKLEATIADLQNKVAREVKANENLLANMRKRKKALQKQYLDLEREVVKLQDQLQKERDTNTALEAVLKNPSGPLPNLSNLDDKTKAELQELAQAESDVISLKQKADAIGMKLNQPPESSKDESDSDSKADTAQSSSSKSGLELAFGKFNQGNLKRSNARGEGGGNTNTPLNKLGTRLNFLKEWRSQIANELQNMEKGRSSGQSGSHKSEKRQGSGSDQNPGKRQGSGSDQNPGKRQGSGSGSASQPEQNPGK